MTTVQLERGETRRAVNVWCFGRTYPKHAKELGNPVPTEPIVFLKPTTALRGLDPAPVAFAHETFDHECEVVLLIGRSVPLGGSAGWESIEGVGLGLDLTRRAVQSRLKQQGLPWLPAKGFAGSGVVSPFVPTEEIPDPATITFALDVDGDRRQAGRFADLTPGVPDLLGFLARHAPLSPGDVVFTGTPEGVGPIRVGQAFHLELAWATGRRRWSGAL